MMQETVLIHPVVVFVEELDIMRKLAQRQGDVRFVMEGIMMQEIAP